MRWAAACVLSACLLAGAPAVAGESAGWSTAALQLTRLQPEPGTLFVLPMPPPRSPLEAIVVWVDVETGGWSPTWPKSIRAAQHDLAHPPKGHTGVMILDNSGYYLLMLKYMNEYVELREIGLLAFYVNRLTLIREKRQ